MRCNYRKPRGLVIEYEQMPTEYDSERRLLNQILLRPWQTEHEKWHKNTIPGNDEFLRNIRRSYNVLVIRYYPNDSMNLKVRHLIKCDPKRRRLLSQIEAIITEKNEDGSMNMKKPSKYDPKRGRF